MRITCLKGGRIIDPINEVDEVKDLYIKGERIINIKDVAANTPIDVIDVEGKIVFPGLVDLRSHLKNISGGQSENISSISKAAAAGGYTTILLMPNVSPKADNPGTIFREEALYYRWLSQYEIAVNSIESRINERVTELERSLENFLRYYPDTIFIDDLSEKINNAKQLL